MYIFNYKMFHQEDSVETIKLISRIFKWPELLYTYHRNFSPRRRWYIRLCLCKKEHHPEKLQPTRGNEDYRTAWKRNGVQRRLSSCSDPPPFDVIILGGNAAVLADSRPPCDTAPSAASHFYANPPVPTTTRPRTTEACSCFIVHPTATATTLN